MSLSIEAESVLAFLKHADQMRSTFTRDQLVSRTHCSDRTVRAAIQELRAAGPPVWSDPTRAGYRLARSWTRWKPWPIALNTPDGHTCCPQAGCVNATRSTHHPTDPLKNRSCEPGFHAPLDIEGRLFRRSQTGPDHASDS